MKRPLLNHALETAVTIAGGQAALARAVGVRQGHVWDWLFTSGRPPPASCRAIEAATGVRCEALREDLSWERDNHGRVTGYRVVLAPSDSVTKPTPCAEQ
ncbi:YdaS family helix-turn-helix protein [Luteibacter sp. PPL552]